MKPLLSYIGSKSRIAEKYSVLIPSSCEKYVEPFVGMGAVALAAPLEGRQIYLNDKSPGIASLFREIRDHPIELRDRILSLSANAIKFNEFRLKQGLPKQGELFHEFEGISDSMEMAVMTFYLIALSFDNARLNMKYINKPDKWADLTDYMHAEARRIPEVSKKIGKDCVIDNAGLDSKVWNYIEDPTAFYFIDPPYLSELIGNRKQLYLQKFSDEEQVEMLHMISKGQAKICIAGYRGRSMLYDKYLSAFKDPYHEWHCYLVKANSLRSASPNKKIDGKSRPVRAEFIWCNFSPEPKAMYYLNLSPKDLTRDELLKLDTYNDILNGNLR